MTSVQFWVIVALLAASFLFLLVPAVVYILRRATVKPSYDPKYKTGISGMLIFSACLLGAVWCLRYAVGYFGILLPQLSSIAPQPPLEGLNGWEEFTNSLVHTLQTFSMDEDYTAYIISGKTMMRYMFGADTFWPTAYGIYASLLNFLAPIIGGAVIFDILARIFPRVKLNLYYLLFWKEKFFFSELNEASLALAKSVITSYGTSLKRPVVVFTDVYVDDENEKKFEIFFEAKMMGAICVRNDLSHVRKNKHGKRKFFLVDEVVPGNLRTLAALSEPQESRYLKGAEIYLFTNDDSYVQVEKNVRGKLRAQWGMEDKDDEELPLTIIPVLCYRNLISDLLVDIPLYEPLIGKKQKNGRWDLTVTILGTGSIGTEMFLSTYWFGQILNCDLKINVLSQETEAAFWNKIDYVNPEIRHTTIPGDPLLRIDQSGRTAPVYCQVKYIPCDAKSSKFIECLHPGEDSILDTDYYLVALGSDDDNISVADTIRRYVEEHRIVQSNGKKAEEVDKNRTVIAYVVYDVPMSKVLNEKQKYGYEDERKKYGYTDVRTDVFMCAIGSLKDVYSVRNVFLDEHEPLAQKMHASYISMQESQNRAKVHAKRLKDEYKHWSSVARGMHIKYKMFSMGLIDFSVIDYGGKDDARYKARLDEALAMYKAVITGQRSEVGIVSDRGLLPVLHDMAWLEHRRWNAYTRVKGFRRTADHDAYAVAGENGSYKQLDVKLHPCLVECDRNGIRGKIDSSGKIDADSLFQCSDKTGFDLLDELSYELYEKEYNDYDFKLYDYPISDF